MEEGHCANCNRELHSGYENDSVNVALERIHKTEKYTSFGTPYAGRPYFCSATCADSAIKADAILSALRESLRCQAANSFTDFINYDEEFDSELHRKLFDAPYSEEYRERVEREHFLYGCSYENKYRAEIAVWTERNNQRILKEAEQRFAAEQAEQKRLSVAREAEEKQRQIEAEREFDELMAEREAARLAELMMPIPLEIPSDHQRFESVHIVGPQGSGKTTLIQQFLLHDLIRKDSPKMIVVDPKRTNDRKAYSNMPPCAHCGHHEWNVRYERGACKVRHSRRRCVCSRYVPKTKDRKPGSPIIGRLLRRWKP